MAQSDCLIGTDIGTLGTKSIICNVEGRVLPEDYIGYDIVTPKPGWADFPMDKPFKAVCETIKNVLAKARILRVNRAFSEITGYAPEEALGQTPRLLQSGCQDQGFYQQMWTQLRTEGRWEGDILNRRKNGEIYPQWLSISAVRNAGGRTSHYVAHFTDITERKHTEKALEEARQRAELASEAKSRS